MGVGYAALGHMEEKHPVVQFVVRLMASDVVSAYLRLLRLNIEVVPTYLLVDGVLLSDGEGTVVERLETC